jgi:DNA-directed RNA polymerase I, II, and III subunit RPABC2
MQSKGQPAKELEYGSEPASDSGSEDENANSDNEEQTPKKDTLSKVKSIMGFGDEGSDNSDNASGSGSDTETETDFSEGEGIDEEVEGEGEGDVQDEEKPNLKSGFSKLLVSLKKAVSGDGDTGNASAAEQANVETSSKRKTKTSSARKKKSKGVQPTQEELEYNSDNDQENSDEDHIEDDDDNDEYKLKKFDKELREDYLINFHPESLAQNYDEIYNLSRVVRDANGVIVDSLHKTLPIMTKYEKTRILGQRAKQINDGATPFVKVPEGVIDGYLIAVKELEEKKIPFIIRRPLPNRGSEYWLVEDLEIIL